MKKKKEKRTDAPALLSGRRRIGRALERGSRPPQCLGSSKYLRPMVEPDILDIFKSETHEAI